MTNKETPTPIKPHWNIRYTIERGKFQDTVNKDQGLTQDMVMVLLMDTDDGRGVRMSTQVYSDLEKPNPNRQFQAMMSIAANMQRDKTVPKWQKDLGNKIVLMLKNEGAKAVNAGGVKGG